MKNEQGFTLIELLLVLFCAVLFASMGLYALRANDRANLSITARRVQTFIRETQDKAYGEQNNYDIGFYSMTGKCVLIHKQRAVKEITMPDGIALEPTNFPRGTLRFSGKLTPSGGGTIFLSSRSHKVKMTVLPVTGRVKIYPIARK